MTVTPRGAPLLAPCLVLAAALAGSCTDVSTGPSTAVAIEFDSLPYPAVITGDTLRDSLGRAAPLHALAYNSAQQLIPGASIRYIAIDSGVTISGAGMLTAQRRDGSARIVASVSGLQSVSRTILVARRPDSAVVTGKLADTLRYALPDDPAVNVSNAISLKLITSDTAGGVRTTQGWLVSYRVTYRGQQLSAADTTVASLWSSAGRVSLLDTTGADGVAARTLRVRPTAAGFTAAESLVVVATVLYRGANVRGSPVRFVIHTRPR